MIRLHGQDADNLGTDAMKVLQFTLSFAEGGRRRSTSTLIRGLRAQGVECALGCLDDLSSESQEISGLIKDIVVLQRQRLFDPRAVWRLHRFCRRAQIDLIHTHDAASQFAATLLRPLLPRVPVLMTFHRSLRMESERRRDRLRNALAGACTAAVVTVSEERRQHFLAENRVSPRKVVCIPNGIDTDRFRPDPATRAALRSELGVAEDTLLLGAAGHFRPEKGIDVVIRGFHQLAQRVGADRTRLLVLGEGTPAEWALITELARSGPGKVELLGFRRDPERWFAALDVFVHMPRLEAFGLVAAEALASGLPVVAAHVGGLPEIVQDGRTGLLVPPEAPEALADALGRLLADPLLRQRLAQQARPSAVAAFGMERFARRYIRLYEALRAGRPPVGVDPHTKDSGKEAVHV
jgi:glycosyltransferase involved in cell wall biosynthesis